MSLRAVARLGQTRRLLLRPYSVAAVSRCVSWTPTADSGISRRGEKKGVHGWKRSFFSTATWLGSSGDHHVTRGSEIDTTELAELVQKGEVKLIDVRELLEVEETGTVAPNVIHIPLGEVEQALQVPPEQFQQNYDATQPHKDQDIVFYCMAGVRSLTALETARQLGFTNARYYVRGWLGWQVHLDNTKTQ